MGHTVPSRGVPFCGGQPHDCPTSSKNICGCKGDWTPASFIESTVASLREQLGDDRVILGLSGGIDSSVAAQLLNLAIGDRLTCIFVDTGLLRKNEYEDVVGLYKQMGLNVVAVKAGDKFLNDLKGCHRSGPNARS